MSPTLKGIFANPIMSVNLLTGVKYYAKERVVKDGTIKPYVI
jgi:hypothetical protein